MTEAVMKSTSFPRRKITLNFPVKAKRFPQVTNISENFKKTWRKRSFEMVEERKNVVFISPGKEVNE